MPILAVDYYAAKRLVEFYEGLSACAGQAISLRRTKAAGILNALLTADADDYAEAQRIVAEYDRAETERVTRRMQNHARDRLDQLMLRPRPEVLL